MKENGWASSGAFYMILAKMHAAHYNYLQIEPEITDARWDLLDGNHKNATDIIYGNSRDVIGILPIYNAIEANALKNSGMGEIDAFLAGERDEESSGKLLSNLLGNTFYDILSFFNPDPFNALLHMVDLGHKIIYYAMVTIAVMLAVSSLASLIGGVPIAGVGGSLLSGLTGIADFGQILGFFVKMAFLVVSAAGIVHVYLIPMIPYIIMLFFVMGMLILVAESLVAAPIWALFHVRLDGQEFVDQVQRPGYMIVFNLLLRPALAVFGLLLSYAVFGAIIWFTNKTFLIAGKSVMLGNDDILGAIILLDILTYIHYQTAIRSFTLITQVPDRVTRWFGYGGENLGEQSDAEKSTQVFMGAAQQRIESATRGAGRQMPGMQPPGGNKKASGQNDPRANGAGDSNANGAGDSEK